MSSKDPFDQARHNASTWLSAVAEQMGTDDRRLALRVLRAWLHTVRDRLSVDSAAKFSAQLPELIRGIYFDGWEPARVPVKYGPAEYLSRFGFEARIPVAQVEVAAASVAVALRQHLSQGQFDMVMAQLPADLRGLVGGEQLAEAAVGGQAPRPDGHKGEQAHHRDETASEDRVHRLEDQVSTLTEAVRVLARGLEEIPSAEPSEQRVPQAARQAAELLLATGS